MGWDSWSSVVFTAPLTTSEALMEQIEYSGTVEDTFFSPAVSLALFNSASVSNLCSHFAGRLPTSTELINLSADVQTSDNWPVSAEYIAEDSGVMKTVDMKTGIVSDYTEGNYLATCVQPEPAS